MSGNAPTLRRPLKFPTPAADEQLDGPARMTGPPSFNGPGSACAKGEVGLLAVLARLVLGSR